MGNSIGKIKLEKKLQKMKWATESMDNRNCGFIERYRASKKKGGGGTT